MLVKLDHLPRVRGKNKKYLKPPPRQDHASKMSMSNEFSTLFGNSQVCQVLERQHENVHGQFKTGPSCLLVSALFCFRVEVCETLATKQAPHMQNTGSLMTESLHWFMK